MVELRPEMEEMLAWWRALPRCGDLPGLSEINPVALKRWLGNFGIVEPIGEPPRYRIRLAGSNLRSLDNFDQTGAYIDELYPPEIHDQALRPYTLCRAQRRAAHDRLVLFDHPGVTIDRLLLPFGPSAEKIIVLILRSHEGITADAYPLIAENRADLVCTLL